MHDFWYALWFFLPAGVANLAPVVAAHLPWLKHWDAPLDCHLHYRGKRLFGASKTWRGLLSGIILAMIIFVLQQKLATHLGSFSSYLQQVHYAHLSIWLGALLGAGALLGDAAASFCKRQVGIAPGHSWFPFDQLDYIVGGCLLAILVVRLSFKMYLLVFVTWFVVHLIFSYFGYLLHVKKTPF